MEELKLQASDETLHQVLGRIEDHLQKQGCDIVLITQILIASE